MAKKARSSRVSASGAGVRLSYGCPILFAIQSLGLSIVARLKFDWERSQRIYDTWKESLSNGAMVIGYAVGIAVVPGLIISVIQEEDGNLPSYGVLAVMVSITLVVVLLVGALRITLMSIVTLGFFALTTASTSGAVLRLWTSISRAARKIDVKSWPPSPVKNVQVVHLTDLHVTESTPYELLVNADAFDGPQPPDCDEIDVRLASVLRAASAQSPLAIAVTGDITDSGEEGEWRRVAEVWNREFPHRGSPPLWVVPGNHDISFNRGEKPDPSGFARMDREFFYHYAESVATGYELTGSIEQFPRVGRIEGQDTAINVVSLNSCNYNSHFILSNAIGKLGSDQLTLLGEQLKNLRGPLLVLLHHHLAIQPERLTLSHPVDSALELAKLPVDALELTHILLGYAKSNDVLVLHGHQHENLRFYVEDKSGTRVHIFGLASSTMGCVQFNETSGRHALDGVMRIGLVGWNPDTGWQAEVKEVVRPPDLWHFLGRSLPDEASFRWLRSDGSGG